MGKVGATLGAIVGTSLGGGYDLTGLLEPGPDERFQQAEAYERLSRMPGFLCFQVRKPGVP